MMCAGHNYGTNHTFAEECDQGQCLQTREDDYVCWCDVGWTGSTCADREYSFYHNCSAHFKSCKITGPELFSLALRK